MVVTATTPVSRVLGRPQQLCVLPVPLCSTLADVPFQKAPLIAQGPSVSAKKRKWPSSPAVTSWGCRG